MSKTHMASTLALLLAGACTSSEPGINSEPGAIEVRSPSGPPVDGTSFSCTGDTEEVFTPCDDNIFSPVDGTTVNDVDDGVELGLGRSWNVVDGGEAAAWIRLRFLRGGKILATAEQRRFSEILWDSQDALDGWVHPVVTSPTMEGRNAGRFSLTFDWGTMSGTYDTDEPAHPAP